MFIRKVLLKAGTPSRDYTNQHGKVCQRRLPYPGKTHFGAEKKRVWTVGTANTTIPLSEQQIEKRGYQEPGIAEAPHAPRSVSSPFSTTSSILALTLVPTHTGPTSLSRVLAMGLVCIPVGLMNRRWVLPEP